MQDLGIAAVHDASFMGQLNNASQGAYMIMLGSTEISEGRQMTHLIDWQSSKIQRKVGSTIAAEANSARKAYDRSMFVRLMFHEIERGRNRGQDWEELCRSVPFCMATDCKSLYDLCMKTGSIPDERRVALDLLDVRESIEHYGDKIRWIPTDHMLVDCMTKQMHPAAMLTSELELAAS